MGLSTQGNVRDTSGNPLESVYIHNQSKNTWTLTDNYGSFILYHFADPGDTLIFTHIGYEPFILVVPQNSKPVNIFMKNTAVLLETVIKTESRIAHNTRNISMGEYAKRPEAPEIDNIRLLRKIPGLTIRSYGGPAGITTAGMDGGASRHIKILTGGFDLTNAQNGQTDISQIPSPFIEGVQYLPNGTSSEASGMTDGVIILDPWSRKNRLSVSAGSYGHINAYAMAGGYAGKTAGDVLAGFRKDKGNYPYSSFLQDGIQYRENNHFSQYYGSARFTRIINPVFYIQGFSLYSAQDRGIAGISWGVRDTVSYRKDHLFAGAFSVGWKHTRGQGTAKLIYRASRENFRNPFILADSKHEIQSWIIQVQNSLKDNRTNLTLKNEYRYDEMKSSDASFHVRNSVNSTLTAGMNILPYLQISPVVHWEYSPEFFNQFTGEGVITLIPGSLPFRLIFQGGRRFVYPSFNDLFWHPGGNPNLKPEYTFVSSIQLSANLGDMASGDFQIFRKESNNLILWMPQTSYWTPKNIQKALRTGWKMTGTGFVKKYNIHINMHLGRTLARDMSDGPLNKKPLRYVPEYSASATLAWNPHNWDFEADYFYSSSRIAMYDYPEDIKLDSYRLWTFTAGYRFEYKHIDLIPSVSGENLCDESYESILGYPEPGRVVKITLNAEFK